MPYGAGCTEDAEEVAERRVGDDAVTLHHSPACGTHWARVEREDRGYSFAWVEAEDGAGEVETFWERAARSWTTPMFHSPDTPVRACAEVTSCLEPCDLADGPTYCSEFR